MATGGMPAILAGAQHPEADLQKLFTQTALHGLRSRPPTGGARAVANPYPNPKRPFPLPQPLKIS